MARAVSTRTKLGNTAVAGTLGFLMFFPILWILILAFKTEEDAIRAPLEILFGSGWTMESFGTVQARSDYFKHFSNSVIISVGSTFLGLLIAVPAAWSMAFVPSKHTKNVLMWMLSTKMLPPVGVLVPIYLLFRDTGLLDSRFGLTIVLMLINLPIIIWMLFTYFKEIPKEIIEAGKMDGVSSWGEIRDIVLPLAWGGVASTALLCFIFCWNEAYWTVRLTTTEAATLSKLIEGNRAPEGLFFGRLSAVSTAAVGPIVVLGWFCQKQLVRGLTFGAVK